MCTVWTIMAERRYSQGCRSRAAASRLRHRSTSSGSSGASMASPIRTVVAATDFSFSAHRAARRAGVLAKAHGAALHLLHVLDSSSARSLRRSSPTLELEQPLRIEAERALASLAADVVAAGGPVSD